MGGTSADVSLVVDSKPVLTTRGKLGPYPLLVPMLDLVTIGAGGGSIGWTDDGGGLRVGPRSAGAMPGPACYGQGGRDPTVTDANLVTGRLNPGYFMHGHRTLDLGLAKAAIAQRVADPLGISVEEAALGILAIAESHMANAIKRISVDRGMDPRDFTLVGFGGAGPLHALKLAEELSIDHVLIPPAPGNVSAMGLLTADIRHDFVRTRLGLLRDLSLDDLRSDVSEMSAEAVDILAQDHVDPSRRYFMLSVDLRYSGQNYELNMPFSLDEESGEKFENLERRFHAEHEQVYGYKLENRAVQLVNLRLTATGSVVRASWPKVGPMAGPPVPFANREVTLSLGRSASVPVYRLDQLFHGHAFAGPAIVEYSGSTLYIPPDWHATYDEMRNAHLVRASHADKIVH